MSDPSIPFTQAKEADVIVKAYTEGKVENFIDNKTCVGLYEKDNHFRLASWVPLSIYNMDRSVNKYEPIFRP